MSMYHFTDSEAIEHDVNTVPNTGDFEMVEVDGYKYWLINRDALLELAGDMDLHARTAPYPSEGRRAAGYARRIREALGVVDR